MLAVAIIMGAGMLLGFLLKARKKTVVVNDRLIGYAIYLLLFLLGVSIGSNQEIMSALSTLGLVALVVAVGAVSGSVVMGWLTYTLFFKKWK